MTVLPIDSILPDLLKAIQHAPTILLSAPPGAGKTTRIPLDLLNAPGLNQQKLILLEPRRLATRRAAEYMSAQLGESVGTTVGFRIRGEARVGPRTRIEVVTEGILTRMLQNDPALTDISCILFDEFHERSIHADLGLALTLDVQTHLRSDLKILIMSATLDGMRLHEILPDAPLIQSEGRAFPVETSYLRFPIDGPIETGVAARVEYALAHNPGDVLAFLPGQREIRRVAGLLESRPLPAEVIVHQLFGEAGYRQQQTAIAPAPPGKRKVILSTSIAETSLTIDGVRVVIDSGLARVPRFDPRRGMAGLVTVPASRATADQRRGRAGRQAPGTCYRLWLEGAQLPSYPQPEILAIDLAPLALELARWGDPEGTRLRFIDRPPDSHLRQARSLLALLGALDAKGGITSHGHAMAKLPVHPRLAHMILRGHDLGVGSLACDLAALLEEREILTERSRDDIDLFSRWHALHTGAGADRPTRERVRQEARRLAGVLGLKNESTDEKHLGMLLAVAYPERVARKRDETPSHYQLVSGTGAVLPPGSMLDREKFLAVGDADGIGTEAKVFLAAPITREEIEEAFFDRIEENNEVKWAPAKEAVLARRVRRLGSLILSEGAAQPEGPEGRAAMIEGIRQMGLDCFPWKKETRSLQHRSEWLRQSGLAPQPWPDLSDAILLATAESWLGPFLTGIWQRAQLQKVDLHAALGRLFHHDQRNALDRLAPSHLTLPSGSRPALQYEGAGTPILAVPLQELFGQTDTPEIGAGAVSVVLHLLSPARRPLAITQDLRNFWVTTYPTLRSQLRARYPKHSWPEDPLTAKPTNRTIRRKRG
jgi:ATP-dependent helicase HrpB